MNRRNFLLALPMLAASDVAARPALGPPVPGREETRNPPALERALLHLADAIEALEDLVDGEHDCDAWIARSGEPLGEGFRASFCHLCDDADWISRALICFQSMLDSYALPSDALSRRRGQSRQRAAQQRADRRAEAEGRP